MDRTVESNSKARDLLLDVVYENSGISKSFFEHELSLVDHRESCTNNEFVTSNLISRLEDVVSSVSSSEETKLNQLKAYDRLCCLQGVILNHTSSAMKHLNQMNVMSRQLEQYSESLLREYARDESQALDQISQALSEVTKDDKLRKRLEATVEELTEKHNDRKGFSLETLDTSVDYK